jgi:hypothetical protein
VNRRSKNIDKNCVFLLIQISFTCFVASLPHILRSLALCHDSPHSICVFVCSESIDFVNVFFACPCPCRDDECREQYIPIWLHNCSRVVCQDLARRFPSVRPRLHDLSTLIAIFISLRLAVVNIGGLEYCHCGRDDLKWKHDFDTYKGSPAQYQGCVKSEDHHNG